MTPVNFGLDLSILIISVVVLGGAGNLVGTIVGAIILGGLEPLLRTVLGDEAIPWQRVIYGGALVLMMLLRPQGLVPEGTGRSLFRRKTAPAQVPTPEEAVQLLGPASVGQPSPHSDVVLEIRGLKKSFGGLVAVGGASFTLTKGEITALMRQVHGCPA
jgi:branched-chain amino acid transport system permease protein